MAARRILILGGTTEARDLAAAVTARFGSRIDVVTSLAGRTAAPADYVGRTRIGGFGGAAGLAAYLKDERIDLLVDATHPFATRISAHAGEAAAMVGLDLLEFVRPAWTPRSGDDWTMVVDASTAAAAVRSLGHRVFLSFGGRELGAFATLTDKRFLVRRIEPPAQRLPLPEYEITLGRGPFSFDAERDLLRRHRIDVLVTKASGGDATRAKLDAARDLRVPVVMIQRPTRSADINVATVVDAVGWIAAALFAEPGIDGAMAVSTNSGTSAE